MRPARLFVDAEPGATALDLPEQRSHYLTRVLRRAVGDPVEVLDGRGHVGHGRLGRSGRRYRVDIERWRSDLTPESPLQTTLGLVLLRGQRLDYALQKSTELGVTQIRLLTSDRCEVALAGPRLASRLAHAREVTISALEQCGRTWLPELLAPLPLSDWLRSVTADLRWLLHPGGGADIRTTRPASAAVLSGPEGGFTEEERRLAARCGFQAIGLGPRTLRAETAPLAALALLQWRFGDLSPG